MTKVYLSLGSNMGDKEESIYRAIQEIEKCPMTKVLAQASLYKTPPVGYTDQDWFLNTAVAVETELPAEELLYCLQQIEKELGRVRDVHWGPRTIDIDILLYGRENIKEKDLTVPHPRMLERGFVLVPLLEIAQQDIIMPDEIDLSKVLDTLKRQGYCAGIEKMI